MELPIGPGVRFELDRPVELELTADGLMAVTAEGEDADALAIATELRDRVISSLEVQDR